MTTERESLLASHPCFDRAYRIYRNAIVDWHASGAIQSAASTLGMTARAYADARLHMNQFQWSAAGSGDPVTREHLDLAYRRVVDSVCGVTDRPSTTPGESLLSVGQRVEVTSGHSKGERGVITNSPFRVFNGWTVKLDNGRIFGAGSYELRRVDD